MNRAYYNFSGGMNIKTSPLILRDDEFEMGLNVNLDELGAVSKRKGLVVAGEIPSGAIISLGHTGLQQIWAKVSTGAGATDNAIYYQLSNGSWILTNLDSENDSRCYFVNLGGTNYLSTAGEALRRSGSLSSFTDVTIASNETINPSFVEVFQARLYVAKGSISAQENRVWFSDIVPKNGGSVTWETDSNNDAVNWFDVNPSDNDEITALQNNGNRLLIFKNNSLYRWNFGQIEPDRLIGVGTSSQDCVKTNFDKGITFFANRHGVYAYTGERPRLLSRKIEPIIKAVTNWNNVFGEIDDEHYYLSVGDIVYKGKEYKNVVLVYHISLDAWTIYSYAFPITSFLNYSFYLTSSYALYLGSSNGQVYEMNVGSSDDDQPIEIDFVSKEYMLSYPDKVTFSRLDVFSQAQGSATIYVDNDRYNQPVPVGQLTERITSLRTPDIRNMNTARICAKDNSTNNFILEGFNLEFTNAIKRDENANRTRKYGNSK